MGHYFINDPNLKSNKKQIKYTFLGKELTFTTDNGVFSKDRVDYGTNVLLNSLEDLSSIKTVLDVGCGVGVIGISIASKYNHLNVDMVDVNEKAVSLTNENIKYNKLNNCCCFVSDVYSTVDNKYDMIISNPPIRAGKVIVHKIAEEAKLHLNQKGFFYAVVQKKQGADSFKKKLEEVYGNVEIVNKDSGYIIFKAINNAD